MSFRSIPVPSYRRVRSFASVCLVSLFFFNFAGCTSTPNPPSVFRGDDSAMRISGNLYGNYLAAGFAGASRDTNSAAEFYQNALERDPDNAIILERAFLLALADGQITQSRLMADAIIARDNGNRMARLVLGIDAFKRNEFELARSHLENSRKGPITVILRDLVAAWSYAGEGSFETALAEIDRGAQRTSFDLFYLNNRAFLSDYAGLIESTERDYLNALDGARGRSRDLVRSYGRFLERQGRVNDAEKLYADYVNTVFEDDAVKSEIERLKNGGSPDLVISSPAKAVAAGMYGAASFLAQERNVDLPIVYLRLALSLDPDLHEARLLLADLFELNRGWEDALRVLQGVPKSSEYYRNAQIRMAINLDRADRPGEAIKKLEDLQRAVPDDFIVTKTLGDLLRIDEKYEEAIGAYSGAIELYGELDEEAWSLLYTRGVAYERTGQWDKAEKDFLTAIELSPEQPLPLNYLGYSWIEKGVNFDRATELIERAVSLSPEDGFIVDSLGWALYLQGKYDAAVKYLEQAVNLQPSDPVINEHLGDAYWQIGRTIEARFQWRQALDLNPEEDLIPKIEKKLDQGLT